MTNEEKIWTWLRQYSGMTDEGIAGLMANMQAESAFMPNNVQNSYEKALGMGDELYTQTVDAGNYVRFETDGAGFGLAQWTHHTRKGKLLAYARSTHRSIGDLEMQLEFCMKEMKEDFPGVLQVLKYTRSIREASDAVLLSYERPADMSEQVQKIRAGYGEAIYQRNHSDVIEELPSGRERWQDFLAELDQLMQKYI